MTVTPKLSIRCELNPQRATADQRNIVVPVLLVGGFVVGLVVGRWWVLLLAAGIGLWIGVSEEVEVPGWYLGTGYAAVSGFAMALGVLLRRR
jgi:hypothetical protein